MNRAVNISLCLAGGLVLSTSLRADDALNDNPYAPIIARNIFGLNPPAPVVAPVPVVEPPVKISPNGIMNIFGKLQVLFKAAAPAIAGKPASDNSYMLAEGQGQDGIEVTHINEKKGSITFNNHGVVEEKQLVAATATSTPAPAPGIIGQPGQIPPPGNVLPGGIKFNPGVINSIGNRGGGSPGMNPGLNPGLNSSSNLKTVPTRIGFTSDGPPVDPAIQTIMIEAQREQYKSEGDPTAIILPPTELTPPEDGGPTP